MTASSTPEILEAFEATLPAVSKPVANYVSAVRIGDLLYTSGALPMADGVLLATGQVGSILTSLETGQACARQCMINLLSVLKDHLGTLQRVHQVVKLTGYVSSVPEFTQHPLVMNAASDLLVELFGDKGRHARTAVGVAALPLDAPVEIDLIVQVAP